MGNDLRLPLPHLLGSFHLGLVLFFLGLQESGPGAPIKKVQVLNSTVPAQRYLLWKCCRDPVFGYFGYFGASGLGHTEGVEGLLTVRVLVIVDAVIFRKICGRSWERILCRTCRMRLTLEAPGRVSGPPIYSHDVNGCAKLACNCWWHADSC